MKITIFGNPGTGTSTVGKLLASKLDYEFMSSGNMFREMAKENGMSLNEFDTAAQNDSKYDIELDKRVVAYAETHDNFIFESRLAWHFIPDSFKVSLIADEEETLKRVAQRENITREEAKKDNDLRMATYLDRYPKYYPDLNYPPSDDEFDIIIDTTTISPEEVVERIITAIKQ